MIDFLKYRYFCLVGSIVLLITGAVIYVTRGFHYHIDFVGGTEVTATFQKPLAISQLRDGLVRKGWKDISIQSVGFAETHGLHTEFIIRTADVSDDLDARLKNDLDEVVHKDENPVNLRGISRVGAEVGKNIRWNSIQAILLSLLIILLYIAIRSRYRFAVGAVIALAHDVLAVLVVFLLL